MIVTMSSAAWLGLGLLGLVIVGCRSLHMSRRASVVPVPIERNRRDRRL